MNNNDIISEIDRINSTIHKQIIKIGVDAVYAGLPDNIKDVYSISAFRKSVSNIVKEKSHLFYTNCGTVVNASLYTLHFLLKQINLTEKELFENNSEITDQSLFLTHLDSKLDNQYYSLQAKFDEVLKKLEPDHRQSLRNINEKLRILISIQDKIAKGMFDDNTLSIYCWQGFQILPQKAKVEFMGYIHDLSSTDNHTFIYLLCSILIYIQSLEIYLKKIKNMDKELIKNSNLLNYSSFQNIKTRITSILKIYSAVKDHDGINQNFDYNSTNKELVNFLKSTSTIFSPDTDNKDHYDLYSFLKDTNKPERILLKIYLSKDCTDSLAGLTQKLEDIQSNLFLT